MSNNSTQTRIASKLRDHFQPQFLAVENESHHHSVPADSETHFKVILVSEQFAEQRLVARHQSVYQLLSAEMKGGVHALALHLYTPEEWQVKNEVAPESPNCLGGSKADA